MKAHHKRKVELRAFVDVPTTKRKCLRCGDEFDSVGPENRICDYCNHKNQGILVLPFSTTRRVNSNAKKALDR